MVKQWNMPKYLKVALSIMILFLQIAGSALFWNNESVYAVNGIYTTSDIYTYTASDEYVANDVHAANTYAANTYAENVGVSNTDESLPIDIPDPQNLYAKSAVLIDGDSGRVLYAKDADNAMPMASTTKIMTCILALEQGKPEDVVTVSEYAASMPDVSLGMQAGEQFYLKDLLYSLMLESHNDTAVAIAEHIAGSVEAFADLMNQKAAAIGCVQTYFITPNGLDATVTDADGREKSHVTTATELALILRYCMVTSKEHGTFEQITTTADRSFQDIDNTHAYYVSNHNAYLTMHDGASSGKTGFTAKAGYCYVGSVRSDGRLFIVALLACGWPDNKSYKWHDMNILVDYGTKHFHYRNIFKKIQFDDIYVRSGVYQANLSSALSDIEDNIDNSNDDVTDIQAQKLTCVSVGEDFTHKSDTLNLLLRDDEIPDITVTVTETLEAPVTKGQLVGMVTYKINERTVEQYPVIAKFDIARISFDWSFQAALTKLLP